MSTLSPLELRLGTPKKDPRFKNRKQEEKKKKT
jgi:hypothetical protein